MSGRIIYKDVFHSRSLRWEFDGTEDEASRSIPYQLQRLFLMLQVGH